MQCELDLTTLRAELLIFHHQYLRIVGARYAELDGLAAQMAEALAHLHPDDLSAEEHAKKARRQANESEQEAEVAEGVTKSAFTPSARLKKLYREVAKLLHPDLTTDERERSRRNLLMAEANRAYESGDENRLQSLLSEWQDRTEAISGDGIGFELIRSIRKIAQVRERLQKIEEEVATVEQSDIAQLRRRVVEAKCEGRNLLGEMAAQLEGQITHLCTTLDELRRRGRVQ